MGREEVEWRMREVVEEVGVCTLIGEKDGMNA